MQLNASTVSTGLTCRDASPGPFSSAGVCPSPGTAITGRPGPRALPPSPPRWMLLCPRRAHSEALPSVGLPEEGPQPLRDIPQHSAGFRDFPRHLLNFKKSALFGHLPSAGVGRGPIHGQPRLSTPKINFKNALLNSCRRTPRAPLKLESNLHQGSIKLRIKLKNPRNQT